MSSISNQFYRHATFLLKLESRKTQDDIKQQCAGLGGEVLKEKIGEISKKHLTEAKTRLQNQAKTSFTEKPSRSDLKNGIELLEIGFSKLETSLFKELSAKPITSSGNGQHPPIKV